MTETILVESAQNALADTIESFYTAPSQGAGTVILAFSATNGITASATYKTYIFNSSGSVLQAIVPQTIVVRDKFDLAPAAISQLIPPGGSLRMESSTASSIAFRVTGDEK